MTKFFKYGDRNRKQQSFDREKITITKAGVTVNVYDQIQANNVDTDIYEVAKKYHIMPDEATELMKEKGGQQGIYLDIREIQDKIKDIGDVQEVANKAQELFEQLPVEIKQKYGNDLSLWYKDQEKKYNKDQEEKLRKEQEEKLRKEQEIKNTKTKNEVTNETK